LRLTRFEKQLCNLLQKSLPICRRPFAEIAQSLGSDEQTVLQTVKALRHKGVIRRLGAVINSHALGLAGTLVTAHIPQDRLSEVTSTVNRLRQVGHNYLRQHYYNLWFTLQASSQRQIEETLSGLSESLGIVFHSLPSERVFKLDVRFDVQGDQELIKKAPVTPLTELLHLNREEKRVLSSLWTPLEIVPEPFAFPAGSGQANDEILAIIERLLARGVIRRLGAIVDHRKVGFDANVLFVCAAGEQRIVQAGRRLAAFRAVSHCYQRKTVPGWPYNLYAMMHGRSMGRVQDVIRRFTEAEGVDSFELLPTETELKRQPVPYGLEFADP